MEMKCSCGKRPKVKCVEESNLGGKMCLKENDMGNFKREERYVVIKYSQLTENQIVFIKNCIFDEYIPTVECVVVEADWSIYEDVWRRVENLSVES